MRIGVVTDALEDLSLAEVVEWCAARGILYLELGVGGNSPTPHVDLGLLLAERSARAGLLATLEERGVEIAALNVSGNPLHPQRRIADAHDRDLRGAIELASLLEVDRIVAMSGCPGAGGESLWPAFASGAWLPDMRGLRDWQWETAIQPYWQAVSSWAAEVAPNVVICLELHPGAAIYNAEAFRRLSEVVEPNVRVNLDPSHFWWQGIDPVRVVEALDGLIGFVHGKDTVVFDDRVALNGLLDFRYPDAPDVVPWHFCAVGLGHDLEVWSDLLGSLRAAGYDGVVSIEHEDPRFAAQEGIEASRAALASALHTSEATRL